MPEQISETEPPKMGLKKSVLSLPDSINGGDDIQSAPQMSIQTPIKTLQGLQKAVIHYKNLKNPKLSPLKNDKQHKMAILKNFHSSS